MFTWSINLIFIHESDPETVKLFVADPPVAAGIAV